ncbi:MAG TPA: DUF6655 family protein [Rhizomicrobium sp.]
MHLRIIAAAAACVLFVSGCTTVRTTSPLRSAQEELLISTAADRAAEALAAQIPANLSVFVDASAMRTDNRNEGVESIDRQYAMAAIGDALLRRGVRLVPDRDRADAVIVPREGVLSTDERATLIGLPAIPAPVPPTGTTVINIPSLSLYENQVAKGIAKFAASVYDPQSGKLITSTDPAYGFSRASDGVVLFLFTWSHNDMGVDMTEDPVKVKSP